MTANQCTEETNVSKVKVAENGKQVIIKNDNNDVYFKTRVDGCLIVGSTASDWIISKKNIGDLIIELKGSDVDRAVEQIIATVEFWKNNGFMHGVLSCLIVCSKYPRIDTKVQRAKIKLAKAHKAPLHIVTKNQEFEFTKVLSFKGPL